MRPAEEIERLLKSLTDQTSSGFDEHTVRDMFGVQDNTQRMEPARSWRDIGRAIMESRIAKVAVAAVLVLTVLLLARHLSGREALVDSHEPTIATDHHNDNNTLTTNVSSEQEQQLRLAQELFEQSDVEGLSNLLDTGSDETKVAVAGYLGQLGDASVLPALQMLANQWKGASEENPFEQSVERIRQANAQQKQAEESVTEEPESEGAAGVEDNHIRITFEVYDRETDQPIPHATIRTLIAGKSQIHEANEQGVFVLDLGESMPSYANVHVRQAGYVWQVFSTQGRTRQTLPRRIRFDLEKAIAVGGIVQDADGRPIAGASIEGHYSGHRAQDFDKPEMNISIEQTTDAEGRWQSGGVPGKIDELWFNVRHPDFADDGFGMPGDVSLADLQAESAVMVLESGISVVGTVTDTAGHPIAGANLLAEEDYFGRDWATTDANGLFEFHHLNPLNSSFPLTVYAPGFTPQRCELARKSDLAPVDFALAPATPLIGRVVDADGEPVEDAYITTEDWNGFRTLKWAGRTDSEGMFVWDYPPDDAIEIRITKSGYRGFRREVVANVTEQTFVLLKPMVIKGTVTDSETGEAIRRFKVIPGTDWSNAGTLSTWQDVEGQTQWFTDGQYRYAFSGDGKAYAVRIEADGYAPTESRFVDATEQDVTIDFALTKGPGPSGYVFDANAEPVAGAEVFWDNFVQVRDGEVAYKTNRLYVTTDTNGHFVLPPQTQQEPLLAICEQGIGGVSYEDFMRDGVIVLMPWARVVGELRFGTQPAVNERLFLISRDLPAENPLGPENETTTDENGRFVFERVYPGRFSLNSQTYEVAPGQTLELHLGGTGRTVHGRLNVPGLEDTPTMDIVTLIGLKEPTSFDQLPKPPGYEAMSSEEVRNRTRLARTRGSEAQQTQSIRRRARMSTGHVFRLDNVEAGRYALLVSLYSASTRVSGSNSEEMLGRLWYEFEVPALADLSELDVPLDLGTLIVPPVSLQRGDKAPDFDVFTFGGDRIRLGDYRGRVLLVSFHSAYSSVYVDRVAVLHDLHQHFRTDRRYAQVSLVVPDDLIVDKKICDEAGLEWPVGYMQGTECREMIEYGVSTLPWNVLIGPDGTILAAGVPTDELEQAVETALASLP